MNKVSSPTVWHWAWDGPPFIFQLQSIIWKYKLTFSWILKVLCHQGQWADAFRNGSQIRNELCWHSYPPLDGGKTANILEPAWPLDAEGSYSSDGKQDSGLSGESLDICINLIFFFLGPQPWSSWAKPERKHFRVRHKRNWSLVLCDLWHLSSSAPWFGKWRDCYPPHSYLGDEVRQGMWP